MPRLWLGNCCTEHMVDRMDLLDEGDFGGILFAMKRLVWMLRDGDAMVLPRPVTNTFMRYVARHTGLDIESIHVISPDSNLLTQDLLHGEEVLGRLREIVKPDWEFRPYIYDRGAVVFARELGLDMNEKQGFLEQGGAELFNSKVVFRAFASGMGFSIPDGMPCRTTDDLRRTMDCMLSMASSVIVKRDRAVGGHGNFVVTTDPALKMVGALSRICIGDSQSLDEAVSAAGLTSTHAPQGEVVVEEFHPDCRSIYAEVFCPGNGSAPYIVNCGELRTAEDPPILVGLEMPLSDMPEGPRKMFFAEVLRMAQMMENFGYSGLVNIDAIVSGSGDLWFNEVNARMGGSTHLNHIAETLAGSDWASTHVLLSRFSVRAPAFSSLLDSLLLENLSWDPEKRMGVVIVADDTETSGTIEYVVLAPTWNEAHDLESRLEKLLTESI